MSGAATRASSFVNNDACFITDPTLTISRRCLAAFLVSDKGDLLVAFCLDDADFFVLGADCAELDFVDFLPVELGMMIQ